MPVLQDRERRIHGEILDARISRGIIYDFAGTYRVATKLKLDFGEIRNGNINTAIELVTQTAFADPKLWRGRTRYTMPFLGVVPREFGLDRDESRQMLRNPNRTWLANIYGFRIIPDGESDRKNDVIVQEVDFHTLTKMHEAFAGTVLTGEHTRIPVPTDPPVPEKGSDNHLNNNLWLEKIRDGYWPIMRDHNNLVTGEFEYSDHDSSEFHLGNMALLPREVQDIITEAATYELNWQRKYQAGEVHDNRLFLAGEDMDDEDPFASGFRWSKRHSDGIAKIDSITDEPAYMNLLVHIVAEKSVSCADRMAALRANIDALDVHVADSREVRAIHQMSKQLADLLNFNSRHRDGRTITLEEAREANEAFLNGVVRVAEKIRGEYKGEDSPQQQSEDASDF